MLIGAPLAPIGEDPPYGACYVVFGKPDTGSVCLNDVRQGVGGFGVFGAFAYHYPGQSISGAGDINGDGLDDFILGARYSYPLPQSEHGAAYVILGKDDTDPIFLSDVHVGIGGFAIEGADNYDCGGNCTAAGAGDVNGDGLQDVIVGARHAEPAGASDITRSGEAYVVFGKSNTNPVSGRDILAGDGGFAIVGIDAGDQAGGSVSGVGDVNGDGLSDVIVAAISADPYGRDLAGESYVVFGKTDTDTVMLSDVVAGRGGGFAIVGATAGDNSGARVSGLGDVNGDGLDDLIVSAPGASPGGRTRAGSTYVVFGKSDTVPVALSDVASGVGGFVINGAMEGDHSGARLAGASGAGDVNGDGIPDVTLSTRFFIFTEPPQPDVSYVVFGKRDTASVELADVALGYGGFVMSNTTQHGAPAGITVSGVGDINADGLDDVGVGAFGVDGHTYVVFGKTDTGPVDLAVLAGFMTESARAGDGDALR